MDERIFDVSKPHKVNPGATSKPVIVGHHPEIPDPMIRENAPDKPQIPEQPEFGPPSDGNPLGLPEVAAVVPESSDTPELLPIGQTEEKPGVPPTIEEPENPEIEKHAPDSSAQLPPTAQMFNKATGQSVEPTHSSWKPEHELPIAGHYRKSGFKKTPLIIALSVLGFLGIYALLDSGLIVDVDLPVHFFSRTEVATQTQVQTPTKSTVANGTSDQVESLPAGWQLYENKEPRFEFGYPSTWGSVSQSELVGATGVQYILTFSNNNMVRVLYNTADYSRGGGGCELSRVHKAKEFEESSKLEDGEKFIKAGGSTLLLSESNYYDSDCNEAEDVDTVAINTKNSKYSALLFVKDYAKKRVPDEQKEFLSIFETLTIN